jgi:FkbM family methyltransferase
MRHSGLSRGLLIEPQPVHCRGLETRFAGQPVAVRQCALLDRDGSASMEILRFNYSSSLLPVLPTVGRTRGAKELQVLERIEVPVRTLDGLLDDEGWSGPIDLLKIDTQGTELRVLQGAARHLQQIRLIWTEVSFRPMYEGSAVFSDIHGYLFQRGFRFYSIHEGFRGDDRELLQADALFIGPSVEAPS